MPKPAGGLARKVPTATGLPSGDGEQAFVIGLRGCVYVDFRLSDQAMKNARIQGMWRKFPKG